MLFLYVKIALAVIWAVIMISSARAHEMPSPPGGWLAAAAKVKLTDLQLATGAWQYTKNHYDNVASFTLRNDNPFPIKDVEIRCRFYAPSGTAIGSSFGTVYEIIPAHGQKKIAEFDLRRLPPQWERGNCAPGSFNLVE
jgi:hypothetical protein